MCGIAGFVGGEWATAKEVAAILAQMNLAVLHRGPDHSGIWIDDDARVAFAHDRLAIIDRSPAGNQPMASPSGRWVISYNGEIYNHAQIREELEQGGFKHAWRGHSDTETLLAAIDAWGVRGALARSKGMFALALWDRSERQLILARDRIGEKPLYYGRQQPGGPFLFGSELKALAAHPQFRADVDRDAVTLLLRHNYIPAPLSIYRRICKLPPGCLLSLRDGSSEPVIEHYWSGADIAAAGVEKPLEVSDDEAVDLLEQRLGAAISGQMIADVPLGAFLSGGIDSSTIVALMQRLSSRPVKTFTIGFREAAFNEAEHAKAVARHLGTEHTELYVTAGQAREVIPKLPSMYDEPFADSSQIPTHLVSELARQQVTVALSGDAGDELFGGYDRYLVASGLWRKMAPVPMALRAAAAKAATAVPAAAWTRVGDAGRALLPKLLRMKRLGDKVHRGAPLLQSRSDAELYDGLLSLWRDPACVVIGADEDADSASTGPLPASLHGIDRMMATDMLGYLPDDILVKVDRAAMAVSLETRAPFLDRDVVELAWRLPFRTKVRNGETKWVVRRLLDRFVPKELIERPKMGFGVPIGEWLRGPLRDWAEALLDPRRLREEGFFRPDPIERLWQAHLKGTFDEQYRLWGILMFQSWLEASSSEGLRSAQPSPAHSPAPVRSTARAAPSPAP